MKKIIVLLMFIPLFVFADVAMPLIEPFVGVVINENGASFYEYDYQSDSFVETGEKLEYGAEVQINDELNFGEYYITDGLSSLLKISDIEPKEGEVIHYNNRERKPLVNTHRTLYLCIIAGVLISATAIVTIVIVNRKKGKVNNNA